MKVVRRAPLLPIGSLITCTRMSSPEFTRRRMSSPAASVAGAAFTIVSSPALRTMSAACRQEGGALQSNLDERRLHAGQHARHAPLVEVAHKSAAAGAFDVQLLHHAVL